MIVSYLLAIKRGYQKEPSKSWREIIYALKNALLSLTAAVIIVGGIISGVFTATESGAVACCYALLLTILYYKELTIAQLPEILKKVAITCGMVFFLVATSSAFGWIMAFEHIPQLIAKSILSLTQDPLYIDDRKYLYSRYGFFHGYGTLNIDSDAHLFAHLH